MAQRLEAARGRTNSSNITIIKSISISWIAYIIAEVATVARPVETFGEAMEEVDFMGAVVIKAGQAMHPLVHEGRGATYAQRKDAGRISTPRRRGIEHIMNLRGY